jgi:DNA polymerase I
MFTRPLIKVVIMNELIYGKNGLDRIVSIQPGDGEAEVFRELESGEVVSQKVPHSYYILFTQQHSPKFKRLAGDQPYKWIWETDNEAQFKEVLSASYKKRYDMHVIRDAAESLMVKDGYTSFKGMKVEDVSVLSFDLEDTYGIGETLDPDGKILLITNTFRRKGKITRKLFAYDEYPSQGAMIRAWCDWVIEMNPSILIGWNLYGHDWPVLIEAAKKAHVKLNIGRDGSSVLRSDRTSKFRKDQSQVYDFHNVSIYGREIVDMWFVAMKYDIAARREYPSHGLKSVIDFELESLKEKKKKDPKKFTAQDQDFLDRFSHGGNRTFYDASTIKQNYQIPEEWKKIKAYGSDDADDPLTYFDLTIPSYFYYAMSIPRSFQWIINSATGSQINSLMVRSYLQQGHSIAMASPTKKYEGAITFGMPGVHRNVFKIDVQSLYPSIILAHKIYNREKDPQALFLRIVEIFTAERIRNKDKAEVTGDRFFKDLSDSQKIAINSMYGFLGTNGLNYNSLEDAEKVTAIGREILMKAVEWATGSRDLTALPESDDGGAEDDAA